MRSRCGVGLPASAKPADVVLDLLRWYPLTPVVVHSTSWRHEESRIILTYVAIVSPPSSLPPDSLVAMPVRRAELARGEAMSAPKSIGVEAELEQAILEAMGAARDRPPRRRRPKLPADPCWPAPRRAWGWAVQLYALRSRES